jgi:hypothetical protein
MATVAEIQATRERIGLELRALRQKSIDLPDGPERDAVLAQRAALSAELKTLARELEVATNQSPATGQFDGIDRNSGQYRYINPVTGTAFLSPTAPTQAQQQQSGQTVPTPAATPLPTVARPETAPAEVQTPAPTPALIETLSPADVPAAAPAANAVAATDAPAAVDTEPVPAAANESSSYTTSPEPQPGTGFGGGTAEDLALFATTAPAAVLPSGTGFGGGTAEDLALFATTAPAAVLPSGTGFGGGTAEDLALFPTIPPTGNLANSTKQAAQEQRTLQQRYKQPGNQDWRVRLVLAEGATYLYKDPSNQLLKPLANSNGVIFPYTPAISTSYTANYDRYDLVHSNYRGYFYKNSAVNDVNITGTFTAQDTAEAQYLLAVIHFFLFSTKMFYGKDSERGAPPPLVYLVGYGEWQFNGHPCLITNFNYNLPADVDYIRASYPNNYGENLLNRRNPTSGSSSFSQGAVATRLLNALLPKGAVPQNTTPAPNATGTGTVNNTQRPTYVPTKMEIAITLLPINTRSQVSQQFSVEEFANGKLLKGGFW